VVNGVGNNGGWTALIGLAWEKKVGLMEFLTKNELSANG
jgi:hypothetical protein